MKTIRIEAFSDGVFAIAITLLTLDIRPPEDTHNLAAGLVALWPNYLAYIISFLLIGLIWANHHAMFEHIARGDRVLLFLNTLLLMNAAFLPFVTAVLSLALRSGSGLRTAVVLYGATLVVGGVFFNAIWAWARHHHRLLGPSLTPAEAAAIGRRFIAGPVLYLLGAGLGAAFPAAGLVMFTGLILFYWLPVTSRLHHRRPSSGPTALAGSEGLQE
jgi:uncharacterized membrane protein